MGAYVFSHLSLFLAKTLIVMCQNKNLVVHYLVLYSCIHSFSESKSNTHIPWKCRKRMSFYRMQRDMISNFKNEKEYHSDPVQHQYTKLPYPPISLGSMINEHRTYDSGETVFLDDGIDELQRINNSICDGSADFA